MVTDEEMAKRLMRKLSRYGVKDGPTTVEVGEALHSLGAIARDLKDSRPLQEAEGIITYVIDKHNDVPTPPEVLEGAVKGAAALGTERAGLALNRLVQTTTPDYVACEALKGISKTIPKSSSDGREKMVAGLQRALKHPSGSVRALAAEYLGEHGEKEHAIHLATLSLHAPEEHVRNSAKNALAELAKRHGISKRDARNSLQKAIGTRPSPSLVKRQEETMSFVERQIRD